MSIDKIEKPTKEHTKELAAITERVKLEHTAHRFSMSRFVSLFHCDCEYERDGNVVYLWEPLHPDKMLTERDRPHWDEEYITFYREIEKDWVRVQRHLMLSHRVAPDVLILRSGLCVEVTTGQALWRPEFERWFIRWQGYIHTDFAKLAQVGLEAYRKAGE